MHRTKVFRNGNSQAVRIPKDLAYDQSGLEMQIERVGDELRIRPVQQQTLSNVMERFARFSPNFLSEGRGEHVQSERDTL